MENKYFSPTLGIYWLFGDSLTIRDGMFKKIYSDSEVGLHMVIPSETDLEVLNVLAMTTTSSRPNKNLR